MTRDSRNAASVSDCCLWEFPDELLPEVAW